MPQKDGRFPPVPPYRTILNKSSPDPKSGAAEETAMLSGFVGAAVHRLGQKEEFCALVAVERPEVGGVCAAFPPRLAVVLVHWVVSFGSTRRARVACHRHKYPR